MRRRRPVAARMLRTRIAARMEIIMAEIPALTRPDQPVTPGAPHNAGRNPGNPRPADSPMRLPIPPPIRTQQPHPAGRRTEPLRPRPRHKHRPAARAGALNQRPATHPGSFQAESTHSVTHPAKPPRFTADRTAGREIPMAQSYGCLWLKKGVCTWCQILFQAHDWELLQGDRRSPLRVKPPASF